MEAIVFIIPQTFSQRAQFQNWGIFNNYSPKWRQISTTFTKPEVNNCFSIYHTNWITSGPKSNFVCENIATKAILFFFRCSEVNSTWLITSELANQSARKVLFTCVVYRSRIFPSLSWRIFGHVTFSDQSRASEKIWWIIKSIIPSILYSRLYPSLKSDKRILNVEHRLHHCPWGSSLQYT